MQGSGKKLAYVKIGEKTGFSLLELMIIIAIMAILSAVALPNLISHRENARLKSGASDMLALFRKAKVNAVKRNFNTVLDFNTAGVVTVYLDNGAGALANNSSLDAGEPIIDTYTVPLGCTLSTANVSAGANKITGFNRRGLPIGPAGSVDILSAGLPARYRVTFSIAGHSRLAVSTNGGTTWD